MKDISIAIQAGGKSTRMGSDKALMEFKSTSLVEYIISQIREITDDLLIISNKLEEYQQFGFPVFMDEYKEIGPIAGLHSAIKNSRYSRTLILGCDMPFHSNELIEYMAEISDQFDVVIPKLGKEKFEPFRAIYSENCLKYVEKVINDGKRRLISFFSYVNVYEVSTEEILKYGKLENLFLNINTKEDLEIAQNMEWRI